MCIAQALRRQEQKGPYGCPAATAQVMRAVGQCETLSQRRQILLLKMAYTHTHKSAPVHETQA